MDSFEREVARFHRQPALRVAKDAEKEPTEKILQRAVNSQNTKSAQYMAHVAKEKVERGDHKQAGEYAKSAAHYGREVLGRDKDDAEDESLAEWAKEEEREPEHKKGKDASASELATKIKEGAHAVKTVAGHAERGAAIGERLAEGRVTDSSPLARVIRRAKDAETVLKTPKPKAIEAHGVKGMNSTPWRKTFPSAEHLNKWAEKNSAEVHATREAEE